MYSIYTSHNGWIVYNFLLGKEGLIDIHEEINRIVPTRIDFKHQVDTPQDAAGHIKSVLIGASLTLIVENGKPFLGHSQGIFLNEFDGPRKRQFKIKCLSD